MTAFWLDFEASSLNPDSYPIEVGWVDETGVGESQLVVPEPSWTDWSSESERIHGIPREHLYKDGAPAATVARRVHEVLGAPGVAVYATSQAYDGFWLRRLLDVAGLPCPVVLSHLHALDAAVRPLLRLAGTRLSLRYPVKRARLEVAADLLIVDAEDRERERGPTEHRALADATSTWRVWRTVTDAVAEYAASHPGPLPD